MPACAQCKADLPGEVRVCPTCGALQPHGSVHRNVQEGTTIDRGVYRLVVDTRLGEGGMGIVWRVWRFFPPGHERANLPPEPLALKILRPMPGASGTLRGYFQKEADALSRLSHPNIVHLFELFEHAGTLMLLLEYVDGDSLGAVISRHVARAQLAGPGALPGMNFLRAWSYFEQLLGALATVHALGIVHRDIKPQNVMIRRDGIVKLTDFGIAKHILEAGTLGAAPPGTGAYMSSEQILGEPLDGRSDLYSAAIVLYEMLAGRTPFLAENKSELYLRQEQLAATPPPLRLFCPQAPPALEALLTRAMAKDKNARFPDAVAMGHAFRSALGLGESPEWHALVELSERVKAPTEVDEVTERRRTAELGEVVVQKYRTAPMPVRK